MLKLQKPSSPMTLLQLPLLTGAILNMCAIRIPLVAMSLSTAFEGYRWSALAVAGAALALVGLVIALRSRD